MKWETGQSGYMNWEELNESLAKTKTPLLPLPLDFSGWSKNERFHQDVVHVKRRQQRRPLYQA